MIVDLYYLGKKFSPAFFLISFLLFATSIFSQTGSISGRVIDKTTNAALPGANVVLEGTSFGAASNLDGNYNIRSIPVGKYTVTVSYIGYNSTSVQVDITADKTLEQNFALIAKSVESKEVVVTAQALGQRGAINQQLTSNTIANIVSAEKISQLPDASAATALSRLPGLSLMNGDQVVIRGIQAKENLILVNGIQLPSTDLNTRATDLGFISSNMLSGIEVIKVVTPDMDANAIGGVVNLRLREAPTGFHFDVLSQGNFNQQDRTWKNYRFWASASNRFLDDKLGVFIQANADRLDDGNDQTSAAYGDQGYSLDRGLNPYQINTFTFSDQQNVTSTAGGSILLDYKLPNGKIKLQNTVSNAIYDNASYNTQFDLAGSRIIYSLNRDKNDKKLLVNALEAEYNFGNLKGELTLSHSYSNKSTDIRYGDPGDNVDFQNSSDAAPFGLDSAGFPITYSTARRIMTPNDVLKIKVNPDDYKGAIIQDWAVIRSQAFKQHIYNAKLDFTLPVSFSTDFSAEFKVGGKVTRSTRSNDLEEWYKRTGDANFYTTVTDFIPGKTLSNTNPLLFTDLQNTDYTRGQYFLEGTYPYLYAFNVPLTDNFWTTALPGWGPSRHQAGSLRFDFNGAEIFSAGYLMGTFSIGPKLTLLTGARLEHYNMDYKASNFFVTHNVDGNGKVLDTLNTVNRNDQNLFPNAQLRYKFTDWADIRVAFSQTISRPDYNAILPNTYFSPGNGTTAGNPLLKPAVSTNYDVYLSFYNNEIGLFTVGGFYKKIKDVFYSTGIYYQNLQKYNVAFPDSAFWLSEGIAPPNPSELINTYINNPYPAYVKGLEFEWQTNFWYLPEPFNSLVLNVNYTRVWSKMDYQQELNNSVSYIYIDPVTGRRFTRFNYVTTDTTYSDRLLNQGNDIVNVALGVDYKGFSGRISFNMQGNVITNVSSNPEQDSYTGNIYKWDFTLKQELPIDGLSVSLSGINIFHNPIKTYQKFTRTVGGTIVDNPATTIYTPREFGLNLRYTL
jgi:TonB-dependent receptor